VSQPYVYLLCGLPFAGKTTLARALEEWLGAIRVALDEINTERGIWNEETGLSSEEWAATYQEAYRRMATVLSRGKSVIDDSTNFTREQRDRVRSVADQHHAHTAVIFVDVPVPEVRRRWQENRRTPMRADVRDEDFAQVLEHFDSPTPEEHVLRYDGTMSVGDWVRRTFPRSGGALEPKDIER
jgi:predicted kinase